MRFQKQNYFIEFRIQGELKKYSRELINELYKEFGEVGTTRKRVVPHVTIIRPFKTKYNKILLRTVLDVVKKHRPIKVKTDNFGTFDHDKGKVMYIDFRTPKKMLDFRNELARKLNKNISDLKEKLIIRKKPDFHLTIAFKEVDKKFNKLKKYLENKKIPKLEIVLSRVTILVENKIYREIDLKTKRVYKRSEVIKSSKKK